MENESHEPSRSSGTANRNTQTGVKKHCSICSEDIDEIMLTQHLQQNNHQQNVEQFLNDNMKTDPFSNKIYSLVNKDESILDFNRLFERKLIALTELLHLDLGELTAIKFRLALIAEFEKYKINENCAEVRHMPTEVVVLLKSDNISVKLEPLVNEILVHLEDYEETNSGWALRSLKEIKLYAYQYQTLGQDKSRFKLPSPDAYKIKNPLFFENEKDDILKFKDFFKKIDLPFAAYADLNYMSQPASERSSTIDVPQREICAFSYLIKCSFDEEFEERKTYIGKNAVDKFTDMLVNAFRRLYEMWLAVEKPMIELTEEERNTFNEAAKCHICEIGGFNEGNDKVVDYCHLTGVYRGPAHEKCKKAYRVQTYFPVILPNLSVYDCHLLAKSLNKFNGPISVIPSKNKNAYISLTKDICTEGNKFSIRFLNSNRFLQSSLDSLVEKLPVDVLVNTKKHFPNTELMLRKGVFPNNYLSKWERLEENSLPPREMFCNELNKSECSQEDYQHAKSVWSHFNCASLKEYLDLYLKSNVLLLADVFENFRKSCKSIYGLDPCHYFKTPDFSWDAMLKTTKVNLELLTDDDMYSFFKSSIRGGLCYCSHRHAKANNKYLKGYSAEDKSQYLMFYDANNAYGWAMSQPLPTGNFQWEEKDVLKTYTKQYIFDLKDEKVGYVLEVDLTYPKYLHDRHNDMPFCPEKTIMPPGKSYKLTANLNDKKKYIIHLKNLQQCLKNGLVLDKVHRVLKFDQSIWLKTYIKLNTKHRTDAKNAFEKDFFKFMNNCIYGKSIENVDEKRTDSETVIGEIKNEDVRLKIAQPNFYSVDVFIPGVTSFEFKNTTITRNKPIFVGFVVLELSKWLMYDFHYDYMKKKFGDAIRINYTDTDSFMYSIWTDDFYKDIYEDVIHPVKCRFDTSDYPEDNPQKFPRKNGKVPGLFKDEANSKIILEFVGLRAKMYAYNLEDGYEGKVKAKGTKISGENNLTIMNNYRKLLKVDTPKDTKRYIREDGVSTYAWGHFMIPKSD